jgi:hypothetical protein
MFGIRALAGARREAPITEYSNGIGAGSARDGDGVRAADKPDPWPKEWIAFSNEMLD